MDGGAVTIWRSRGSRGSSRTGGTAYDPKYCDKYKKGPQILKRWRSDDMTWKEEVADGEEENS